MASLVSPGVSISVIDESINAGTGPGTVPLIFIATKQDKTIPDGSVTADGTLQANAGRVYSITSQRELLQTFGDPSFYEIGGSSINGYPLNEYGLLAAHSYLGVANLCRVVRADIDTAQLEPRSVPPTSPAAVGTYWLDESSTGSSYGLFTKTGIAPNQTWAPVKIDYVFNFATGTNNSPTPVPDMSGILHAVVFNSASGTLTYWTNAEGAWTKLTGTGPWFGLKIQQVWPDTATTTEKYWVKTGSAAQGANIVLRKMEATSASFIQVETPILINDAAASLYYGADASGQVYASVSVDGNSLIFKQSQGASGPWSVLTGIVGSPTVPTAGPVDGQLWFNSELGVDGDGKITVDILVADGNGGWQNTNLSGWTDLDVPPGQPTVYAQSADPRDNLPTPVLSSGDVWVDTDVQPYPVIKKWNGSVWALVDNKDQTTPNGIIFADARPNPMYHNGISTGENNGGGSNPDLDPDAPDSDMYPRGFMLWNTRYSTNNIKKWHSVFTAEGITASEDDTNNNSTGRWVTESGNDPGGVPYMGTAAQKICVVRAIQAAIVDNDEVRAEDIFFNLIAAPGFVEAIDELVALNQDRKETAFIVADSPFTLSPTGTALQAWSTNSAGAYSNGDKGLTTQSKYFGVWYPSGLSTNVDGTDVVVPPSHMALRTIAYSDQVSYPWFAPAGLQRGVVTNAASVGYVNDAGQYIPVKLNEGQRDILYQNNINPIRTMPTGGNIVWGQKTRQPYSSASDRINVVRLENYLRYQLDILSQPFLFEPNDKTTRSAVKDAFDRFFAELITLRAIYDFLVVCDESNNTPARIDRNELWIDVAYAPTKSAEFIYIPMRIRNTGAV